MWATCENTRGSHKCECISGTEGNGAICRDIDECKPVPCKNGAKCNNELDGFSCECAAGWVGPTCEVNVNECNATGFPAQQWVDFTLTNVTWKDPCLVDTIDLSGKASTCTALVHACKLVSVAHRHGLSLDMTVCRCFREGQPRKTATAPLVGLSLRLMRSVPNACSFCRMIELACGSRLRLRWAVAVACVDDW